MTPSHFAARVHSTCKTLPSGHTFGRKAWIHRVWLSGFSGLMDYTEFKRRLWAGCNQRALDLSRCDMVEAFDCTDVRRSNLEAMGCTFNFVNF